MIMVPLYLGIAVSIGYSIHIFTFFKRHFLKTGKRKDAVRLAVKETGWPILFTALTTVGALFSFHFVDVKPVRWIGSSTMLLVTIIFFHGDYHDPGVALIWKSPGCQTGPVFTPMPFWKI